MHSFRVNELSIPDIQEYLQHAIAPRPVALVSTVDKDGKVNLSPFSFFNLFSVNPPVCVFSPSRRVRDNTVKHTLENIQEVAECVINIVDYSMVAKVNQTSCDYAKGVSEFFEAGLTPLTSEQIRPPRVAESPVQLECTVKQIIPLGEGPGGGNLVLAEVVIIHLMDGLLKAGKLAHENLDLVARLGGDWYCRVIPGSLFALPKPVNENIIS